MKRIAPLCLVALLAGCASSQPQVTVAPVAPYDANAPVIVTVQGHVQAYERQGESGTRVLLATATGVKAIEVNEIFAPILTKQVPQGELMEATVVSTPTLVGLEGGEPGMSYRLLAFRTAKGDVFQQPSTEPRYARVNGMITAQVKNAAGATVGVQLDTGDVVYLNAREVKQNNIAVGEEFSAEGVGTPMAAGGLAIRAQQVNGMALRVSLPQGGWGRRAEEVAEEAGDIPMGAENGDLGGDFGGDFGE